MVLIEVVLIEVMVLDDTFCVCVWFLLSKKSVLEKKPLHGRLMPLLNEKLKCCCSGLEFTP